MKKVAIVGVEGSGKTVMLSCLGELYSHPDANGYFLSPVNFRTTSYVNRQIAKMRAGEWPSATSDDEMQALWEAVMGNNPSHFKGADLPVENVSWNDCQAFIKKLNGITGGSYRLPTEEEWEYACRAGSTGKYGLLADGTEGKLDEIGWYHNNSCSKPHPVGQK